MAIPQYLLDYHPPLCLPPLSLVVAFLRIYVLTLADSQQFLGAVVVMERLLMNLTVSLACLVTFFMQLHHSLLRNNAGDVMAYVGC